MDRAKAPSWPPDRVRFYRSQASTADQLTRRLTVREGQLLESAQNDSKNQIQTDQDSLASSQKVGVDSADLTPLRQRLDGAVQQQSSARTITDYRKVAADAHALNDDIATLAANQAKENEAIQTVAADVKAKAGGNLDVIHRRARMPCSTGATTPPRPRT